VVHPDIVHCGRFLETKKITALAEAQYVSVGPHNCDGPLKTMIGVYLCANIPNFMILETSKDYDVPRRCDLTPGAPRVKNGFYEVPTGAGWGIEIDEAVIAAHSEDPDAKLTMFSLGWEQQNVPVSWDVAQARQVLAYGILFSGRRFTERAIATDTRAPLYKKTGSPPKCGSR
jgi:hypothetical protein